MPLSLLPAQETDLPAIVRLQLSAFASHPRIPIQWPLGYTPDLYAYKSNCDRRDFLDPKNRYWKAVDAETGEMVAAADWTFHLEPVVAADGEVEAGEAHEAPPEDWPEGGNWALKSFYRRNFRRMEREYLEGKGYIVLNVLTVLKEHQGRGAGSLLLQWGVEEADKLRVCMCLESTPAGLALYQKAGFVVREVIAADMGEFGWTKPYDEEAARRIFMIREAR